MINVYILLQRKPFFTLERSLNQGGIIPHLMAESLLLDDPRDAQLAFLRVNFSSVNRQLTQSPSSSASGHYAILFVDF